MNILGYVSAILILIGIALQSYYSNWFVDQKLQDGLKGYHTAFRSLEKEYSNQIFSSIPEKKESKSHKKNSKNIANSHKHFKKELTPYCMRLNLWIYKKVDANNDINFSALEKLIAILYGNKIIETKNIPKFTKSLIVAIQAKKSPVIHLEQLKLKNPQYQEIYYQMLKGKEDCFPSFLNYITLKADNEPKICIACADLIILTSLFGEQVANTLMLSKKNLLEQITIDSDTFNKIVSSNNVKTKNLPKFLLKHKKSSLEEIVISSKEPTTQILLKQKLQLNFKDVKKSNLAKKL